VHCESSSFSAARQSGNGVNKPNYHSRVIYRGEVFSLNGAPEALHLFQNSPFTLKKLPRRLNAKTKKQIIRH
jgi:hypothetical protein